MKQYKAYLFDFDYTLADSSRGILKCFRNVLERHGYKGIEDFTIKRTIGKTLEDSFSILTGVTDASVLETYRKEYVKEADQYMTVNTFLFPEVADTLLALKKQGAKIGIISTKYRYRIMELMGQKLPEGILDIVVGGEDVTAHKPSPEGLCLALEKLNVQAEDTLYIGDSTVDAETAQAGHVDFLGVLHGMTSREELEAYPHVEVVADLKALLNH